VIGRACWVVPCYNEASRLDVAAFVDLVDADPAVALLFVDDGSRDATSEVLAGLVAQRPERIGALRLERNGGKGEAVRRGMLEALRQGAAMIGYLDADLATPTGEVTRLTQVLVARDVDVVIGSRVALLGRRIERRALRHYAGRVFATAASSVLRLPIYDTQCGAKLFRRSSALQAALATPFRSRWVFDVELLGRLLAAAGEGGEGSARAGVRLHEEPLQEWRDVAGSKLRPRHLVGAALDLSRIAVELRRRPRP